MLALPLLTNDISVSDESSYDLSIEALPLVNGDLDIIFIGLAPLMILLTHPLFLSLYRVVHTNI